MQAQDRIAEISKQMEDLRVERNQLQGVILDTYIGRFFKFQPVTDAEREICARECTYFYVSRRWNDVLLGPVVKVNDRHGGALPHSSVSLEAEFGPFFIHPKHCTEITADEFKRAIHEALDRSLLQSE